MLKCERKERSDIESPQQSYQKSSVPEYDLWQTTQRSETSRSPSTNGALAPSVDQSMRMPSVNISYTTRCTSYISTDRRIVIGGGLL
jgi:hypothetical protein